MDRPPGLKEKFERLPVVQKALVIGVPSGIVLVILAVLLSSSSSESSPDNGNNLPNHVKKGKNGPDSEGPKASPGRLTVESTPAGAQVFLDKKSKGSTPLSLKNIRPGKHELTLTKSRHKMFTQSVEIESGKRARIEAVLEPFPGELLVQAGMSGVEVRLSAAGKETISGVTDAAGKWEVEVPPGTWQLVASKKGYAKVTAEIHVSPQDELMRPVHMVKMLGALIVKAGVAGAHVNLSTDGQAPLFGQTGDGGTWSTKLEAGRWTILVVKKGFAEAARDVDVEAGVKETAAFELQALTSRLQLQSNPSGLEVFQGERSLGRTPLAGLELGPGEHTYRLRDADGFEAGFTWKEAPGWTYKRTLDFAAAVKAERTLFDKLVDAEKSSDTEAIEVRASAYLKEYPRGAKRQHARRLADAARKTLAAADEALQIARDIRLSAEKRIEGARLCLTHVSTGKRADEAKGLIADLDEDAAFAKVMSRSKDEKLSVDERVRELQAFAREAKSTGRVGAARDRAKELQRGVQQVQALARLQEALSGRSLSDRKRAELCAGYIYQYGDSADRDGIQKQFGDAWKKVEKVEEAACFARVKKWMSSKEPWNVKRAVLESYLRFFPDGAHAPRAKDWLDGIERKISSLERG